MDFIDLPGIIAISDNDREQEKLTKDIALQYCKEDTTTVVLVCGANVDFENNWGLKILRDNDIPKERVIAALPMFDLIHDEDHIAGSATIEFKGPTHLVPILSKYPNVVSELFLFSLPSRNSFSGSGTYVNALDRCATNDTSRYAKMIGSHSVLAR